MKWQTFSDGENTPLIQVTYFHKGSLSASLFSVWKQRKKCFCSITGGPTREQKTKASDKFRQLKARGSEVNCSNIRVRRQGRGRKLICLPTFFYAKEVTCHLIHTNPCFGALSKNVPLIPLKLYNNSSSVHSSSAKDINKQTHTPTQARRQPKSWLLTDWWISLLSLSFNT